MRLTILTSLLSLSTAACLQPVGGGDCTGERCGDDMVDKRGPGLLRLRLQRLGLEFRHEAVLRERAREATDVARRCGVRGH